MKFEILQEQLLESLGIVGRAVAVRAQLPILSHILIEAKHEGLVLSATDLELGIRVKLPAKVEKEGRAAVPAKMFGEFLASLSPGKIEVVLEKETVVVSAPGYRGKFQTIDAGEFPVISEIDNSSEICTLDLATLASAVDRVVFASAKDTLRPVLTGVLWEAGKKKLRLVATDGFRLAIEEIALGSEGAETRILVPSRGIVEAARMVGTSVRVGHLVKTNQVAFEVGETLVVSQLLDGNFPDYGKILPKEFAAETTTSREELLKAVKAAHIFARDNSNMVRWQFGETGLVLVSSSPERGECRVEVGAKVSGNPEEIVFNAKYVVDYLSISQGESVWIGTGGKLAPGMFKEVGRESGQYVVMPINA